MKMRSGMKRLDWLVGWLPSELMNDPSNTHHTLCGPVERAYPITGSGGSARLARQMSSTFSYSWTGSRPVGLSQIKTRNEKEGRGTFHFLSLSLSLYLYFASRCPPVSQLTTLTTLLTLSPQLATNLSSIFRHLLIIIPIPAVLLVPGQGQLAQKIPRHPSTHNVQVYELIPT